MVAANVRPSVPFLVRKPWLSIRKFALRTNVTKWRFTLDKVTHGPQTLSFPFRAFTNMRALLRDARP